MNCIGEAVRRNLGKFGSGEACDFAENLVKEAMLSDRNLSEVLGGCSGENETKRMNTNVLFMAAVLTLVDEVRSRNFPEGGKNDVRT